MTVSFWTPGRIPLDAFTMMGANVKLNDNPIGQFGTGLKYAVAVILRHDGNLRCGNEDYADQFTLEIKEIIGVALVDQDDPTAPIEILDPRQVSDMFGWKWVEDQERVE